MRAADPPPTTRLLAVRWPPVHKHTPATRAQVPADELHQRALAFAVPSHDPDNSWPLLTEAQSAENVLTLSVSGGHRNQLERWLMRCDSRQEAPPKSIVLRMTEPHSAADGSARRAKSETGSAPTAAARAASAVVVVEPSELRTGRIHASAISAAAPLARATALIGKRSSRFPVSRNDAMAQPAPTTRTGLMIAEICAPTILGIGSPHSRANRRWAIRRAGPVNGRRASTMNKADADASPTAICLTRSDA